MTTSRQKRRYTIMPARTAVALCGKVKGTAWQGARTLRIDRFPWFAGGARPATVVRMLYDRRALYAQFRCRDRHISAVRTRLNSDVFEDSCVELFLGPDGEYFNVEINCCGTLHLGFGAGRRGRRLIEPDQAARIRIATSVPTATKDESPDDAAWRVTAAIPFAVLSSLAGRTVRPRSGDVWGGNLYRCGGQTDPQHACWNPITSPQPDYHRPECFGDLRFA